MDQQFWNNIRQKLEGPGEKGKLDAVKELCYTFQVMEMPVADLLRAGIVPSLVNLLETSSFEAQREALWILIYASYGSSSGASSIADAGGIPKLIRLMESDDLKVADGSTWVLANLCGDNQMLRNLVLQAGVVSMLCKLLEQNPDLKPLRNLVWLSLNIIRNSSAVPVIAIYLLIKPLLKLIEHGDRKVVVDCCWFYTNLVLNHRNIPEWIIDRILARIKSLLSHSNYHIVEAALRFVYNVHSHHSEGPSQLILSHGMLPELLRLLDNKRQIIARLSIMCCRKYTSGGSTNVQQLLDANVLQSLSELFEGATIQWESKREGISLLQAIINRGVDAQVAGVANNVRLVKSFCALLASPEPDLLKKVLVHLQLLVQLPHHVGQIDYAVFKDHLTDCGLSGGLQDLLDHVDDDIHKFAYDLMQDFYPEELPYDSLDYGPNEE